MYNKFLKYPILTLTAITLFTIAACGKNHNAREYPVQGVTEIAKSSEEYHNDTKVDNHHDDEKGSETAKTATNTPEASEMKSKFGENCIPEQTFEVKLSEYDGKVSFVPFTDNGEFYMQIMQNGDILDTLDTYIPERLNGKSFTSLDAVSFFDVNYDGETDIVLVETYGTTSFAVVYYGEIDNYNNEKNVHFYCQETLSDNISARLQTCSIPEIRTLLSGGKKNGEFSSYKEAYEAAARLTEFGKDENGKYTYDLIYVDEDDIPELSAGHYGYYVDLYTYQDGTLYLLMNQWGYGAMGCSGYYYAPRQNSIRLYDQDFAGALMHTIYWKINGEHALEHIVTIDAYNFDDANGNGQPDEEEMDSLGKAGKTYIDEVEVSDDAYLSYEKGEYGAVEGIMTFDELMDEL